MNFDDNAVLVDPREAQRRGRAFRESTPRTSLAHVAERTEPNDPVSLLTADSLGRTSALLALRYERMLLDSLSFFRGAASLQALDLARGPSSGIEVQLCGDAHLSNFGIFSSPERRQVFDVNDFDHTAPGPFEWDVKRLASSLVVAGDHLGLSAREQERAAQRAARKYRTSMLQFARLPRLSVWYADLELDQLVVDLQQYFSDDDLSRVSSIVDSAVGLSEQRRYAKLIDVHNGHPHIAYHLPVLIPLDKMIQETERNSLHELLTHVFSEYRESLAPDMQHLLAQFTPIDAAQKVVGVGSVGTHCYVILLLGRDENDTFFLQIKEAVKSVLDQARGTTSGLTPGERVVRGQRLMQATPDIFLGSHRVIEFEGFERSFYVRQLFDNKRAIDVERLDRRSLASYGELCGWTLARAHARSGKPTEIAGYLGNSEKFDDAVVSFALAYKKRNAKDFHALQKASAAGRLPLNITFTS